MISAMKFWVEETNIDGYRCDYADGVPYDFWQQAMDSLYAIPGRELIMFAEGTRNDHYAAGFDLTFGWHFYDRLSRIYNDNASASTLIDAHNNEYSGLADGDHVVRFIDNHDFNAWEQTPLEAFNGEEGATTAFAVTSLMGGATLIYNGQEVACDEQLPFFEGHDVTIDWTANPEVLAEYQQLIDIRTSYEAFSKGDLQTLDGGEDVVVFSRTAGDEQLFVVANVRNRDVSINTPSGMAVDNLTNVITGEAYELAYSIDLEAFEYLILK
jgi:glycosidase